MIGMDQQAHDCGFVDSGFAVLGIHGDFIPDPTPCSRFGWLSDDLVTMLDQQDYSSVVPAVCADVYQMEGVLASGSPVLSGAVSLGDYFAGDLVAGSSDISVMLDVNTGRISPASLGKPGHEAALVDSVEDAPAVQSVKYQQWLFNLDPIIFEQETIALLARSATDVPYGHQKRVNNIFKAIKAGSVLARLDTFYMPMQWQDEQAGCLDWIRPVSASMYVGASWDPGLGFVTGSAYGSYINTNFTPSLHAVNMAPNSCGIGAYITGLPINSSNPLWDALGPTTGQTRCAVYVYQSPNVNSFSNCSITGDSNSQGALNNTQANSASNGVIQHNRASASLQELYMNGTLIGAKNYTNNSRALPNVSIPIGASNTNGYINPSSGGKNVKLGAWWAGHYLDQYAQQVLIDAIAEYLE